VIDAGKDGRGAGISIAGLGSARNEYAKVEKFASDEWKIFDELSIDSSSREPSPGVQTDRSCNGIDDVAPSHRAYSKTHVNGLSDAQYDAGLTAVREAWLLNLDIVCPERKQYRPVSALTVGPNLPP
jgi:hypothetical protein